MSNVNPGGDENNKNAPYRSSRRAAHQGRTTRRSRGQRRIIVTGELRETPDVRKIARAIIAMALADAEREAQAQAEAEAQNDSEPGTEASAVDADATGAADD